MRVMQQGSGRATEKESLQETVAAGANHDDIRTPGLRVAGDRLRRRAVKDACAGVQAVRSQDVGSCRRHFAGISAIVLGGPDVGVGGEHGISGREAQPPVRVEVSGVDNPRLGASKEPGAANEFNRRRGNLGTV
jgi:hypothetical protein